MDLIAQIQELLGKDAKIILGKQLESFTTGFRGKKGHALVAVEPRSLLELYRLIRLCDSLKVGYLLQGANTSLKGQSTPNGEEKSIIIIRTNLLKKMKILNYPDEKNYKILLVEPGLTLKEAEIELNKIGFDLPHKIGSHDLGNTFGASCATGCGGVRVDNRDGRSSLTETGNMGVVSIGANGLIYNGFIKPDHVQSGEELISLIDRNAITEDDIILPKIDEIQQFIKQLFIHKSYPIRNHRGSIIFSGDGGEGSQAIAYQMYLIRKKPQNVKTAVVLFLDKNLKENFYKEVIFSIGAERSDELPILCESMNSTIVKEIVNEGAGYVGAFFFATKPSFLNQYIKFIFKFRNYLIKRMPIFFLNTEFFLGRVLSFFFTPKIIKKIPFFEMVILQFADRESSKDIVNQFEKRLNKYVTEHAQSIRLLNLKPGTFTERLVIQIRTVSALATLALAIKKRGTLFAFDDAIMPGTMMEQYCELLYERLNSKFPERVNLPYLYGHDLKQINHNDWIIEGKLTPFEILEIEKIQHKTIKEAGGIPHAEHGFGDYADLSLDRDELVKLVAHRIVNDPDGLANPGGGPERAYLKAIKDETILRDGQQFANKATERELDHKTLLWWD